MSTVSATRAHSPYVHLSSDHTRWKCTLSPPTPVYPHLGKESWHLKNATEDGRWLREAPSGTGRNLRSAPSAVKLTNKQKHKSCFGVSGSAGKQTTSNSTSAPSCLQLEPKRPWVTQWSSFICRKNQVSQDVEHLGWCLVNGAII